MVPVVSIAMQVKLKGAKYHQKNNYHCSRNMDWEVSVQVLYEFAKREELI